jgi:hypothetical protein
MGITRYVAKIDAYTDFGQTPPKDGLALMVYAHVADCCGFDWRWVEDCQVDVLNHLVLTGELPQGNQDVIALKLEALKQALVKILDNASLIPDINAEVDALTGEDAPF